MGHERLTPGLQPRRLAKPRYGEEKRVGWEMRVRMEKIVATVLHEAHERQVEEALDALEEGPKSFYGSSVDR